jgi:hypothetical protein
MLRSAEAEQCTVLAAEQNTFLGSQAGRLELALGGETRAAVKRERTVPEDGAEQAKDHDSAGEGRKRQPAVETWVGAVTGPACGDLRPVKAAVVKPEPQQQHV